MDFSKKLCELREQRGLSQYALAKLSGLSKQALSKLELGNREPTWQTVQLLALALGVDPAAFVDPSIKPPADAGDAVKPRGRPKKDVGEVKTPGKKNGK